MPDRQAGIVNTLVAAGIVLLVLGGAGCESSSTSSAAGLPKPSDARKAISDAIGRTSKFKDVKYDAITTEIISGRSTVTKSVFSATRNPAVIDIEAATAGQVSGVISNLNTGVVCFTHPVPGQPQTRSGRPGSASQTDPFDFLITSTGWQFRPDVDLRGHHDWHLSGIPATGNTFNGVIKFSMHTVDVFIDSQSGKIQLVQTHAVYTNGGPAPLNDTSVDDNFVYDSGVKITTCP